MRHLLSIGLIFSLVANPAFADGNPRQTRGAAIPPAGPAAPATDPAAAPADPAAAAGTVDANMCKSDLNAQNPLKPPVTDLPRKPDGISGSNPPSQVVTAQDVESFKFAVCDKVRAASGDKTCDNTLANTFKAYAEDHKLLDDLSTEVKTTIANKASTCATGQAAAQTCMAGIYQEVSQKFNALSAKLKQHATGLKGFYGQQAQRASDLLDPAKREGRQLASIPALNRANGSKYLSWARDADLPKLRNPGEPRGCHSPMAGVVNSDTPFCGHVVAAMEANYYQKKFLSASEIADKTAKCFGQSAKTASARAAAGGEVKGGGNPSGQSTVTGKSGGMGLDDIMKLATLGMTGGALYCSISKSCSPSSSSDSATNSDTQNGATSPTPNGTNQPTTETSSLGASSGGPAPAPAPGSATATTADTGTSQSHGGSGFDSALQHFNGALDSRAPASSPSTGGSSGGGSGGGGSGLGGGSSSSAPAPAMPDYKPLDGTGVGVGGGGLASGGGSSGFNLGSSAGAPADAALKNILNGDAPPGLDAGLAPLGDLAVGAGAQASDSGKDDPENLFTRTRLTHVRCLKRGCVGAGVGTGDNI